MHLVDELAGRGFGLQYEPAKAEYAYYVVYRFGVYRQLRQVIFLHCSADCLVGGSDIAGDHIDARAPAVGTVHDTILDFYAERYPHSRSRAAFLYWRGLLALRDNRPKAALAAVREGMKEIEGVYEGFDDEAPEDGTREVAILRALVKEIEDRIPPDPVKRVEKALSIDGPARFFRTFLDTPEIPDPKFLVCLIDQFVRRRCAGESALLGAASEYSGEN